MKNHNTQELLRPSCFANRMNIIPRSCIRELLSGGQHNLISFGGGVPNDCCVPLKAIQKAFDNVMTKYGARAFRYGSSEGEAELREFIACNWLTRFGLEPDPADILIVNGSQQALDLLGKVLIDCKSPVLMERPTYIAALQAFSAFEPEFIDMPLCDEGVDIYNLEEMLRQYRPRLFYTIPTFQNPSGLCYSKEKRRACSEALNRQKDCVLIEDDPYSELYYDCKPPNPICAEGTKNAVFLGTFSKIVAPGFRIGWIWAKGDIKRHLITAKQAADLCTGRFQQLLLIETLRNLDIDLHLQNNRDFYKIRRKRMNDYMSKNFSGLADWSLPHGGMFFWVTLRHNLNARTLLAKCIQDNVAFADGISFHTGGGGESTMRLNFTQLSFDDMKKGLELIAGSIRQLI